VTGINVALNMLDTTALFTALEMLEGSMIHAGIIACRSIRTS
jgi:hypothetical protein